MKLCMFNAPKKIKSFPIDDIILKDVNLGIIYLVYCKWKKISENLLKIEILS